VKGVPDPVALYRVETVMDTEPEVSRLGV
jgi:hypothetical protein